MSVQYNLIISPENRDSPDQIGTVGRSAILLFLPLFRLQEQFASLPGYQERWRFFVKIRDDSGSSGTVGSYEIICCFFPYIRHFGADLRRALLSPMPPPPCQKASAPPAPLPVPPPLGVGVCNVKCHNNCVCEEWRKGV